MTLLDICIIILFTIVALSMALCILVKVITPLYYAIRLSYIANLTNLLGKAMETITPIIKKEKEQ